MAVSIRNLSLALVGSVVAHAVIFALVWLCLVSCPATDICVELDLSSVELSFSEKEEDFAALAQLPTTNRRELRKVEPEKPRLPEVRTVERTLPPDPAAVTIPEPQEPSPQVVESAPSVPVAAPVQAKIEAPPRPKKTIRPAYPDGSRRRGEQGEVVLAIEIAEDGSVSSASVATSSGYPELDAAALKAVRAAVFSPAKSNGRAVAASARLALKFKLK